MSAHEEERVHQLDALRAGALLLGVVGHATISFFPVEASWVADDVDSSPVLLVANFVSHIFRMSLFFAIAGFFAHMLLRKRGVSGFIANRLKRIALPFVVFWPILLAGLFLVAMWEAGWTNPLAGQEGAPVPSPSGGARVTPPLWQVLPLGHTWFLYVLVWFYAGALALVGLTRLLDSRGRAAGAVDATVRALGATHVLPFVLAAPLAAVFFLHEHWTVTGGIRTPDFGLVPNVSALVGFGTAFVFGWFLRRQPTLLNVWQRSWLLYWIAAVALTAYCARSMSAITSGGASLPTTTGGGLLVAAAYPLAIWAWCLALLGTATRFLSAGNKVIRYLADSSYWIYLVHLPLVVALQVWVSQWPLGWPVKYPLILAIAIPTLLASYELLVRNTFLGAWLNGRRYGRAHTGDVGVALDGAAAEGRRDDVN
jgi:peptidoglycan/LPS O-acetylase OafA/YrhL